MKDTHTQRQKTGQVEQLPMEWLEGGLSRQMQLMDLRCLFLCAGGGGGGMYVVTAHWYKLSSRCFNQPNRGYSPPASRSFFFFRTPDRQDLSPPPYSHTTQSSLPHLLLSLSSPPHHHHAPSLEPPCFPFTCCPSALLMLRPHQHPAPARPRRLAAAPRSAVARTGCCAS